jgi:hypothetical protein
LRDAENRGFDIHTELPMLVTGRSFVDAEDIASVLHYRIDRYLTGVGYLDPPASELVCGLFPRPTGNSDPDVALALHDRADAIEQRARELATTAIERGDAWVQDFGDAPPETELCEQWVLEVAAGAAYLDRWGTSDPGTILDTDPVSREQKTHYGRVLNAVQRARTLSVIEDIPTRATYVLSGDEFLYPSTPEFGFDR